MPVAKVKPKVTTGGGSPTANSKGNTKSVAYAGSSTALDNVPARKPAYNHTKTSPPTIKRQKQPP
jgi:hypothetical protein